jgi:hypothetical protein
MRREWCRADAEGLAVGRYFEHKKKELLQRERDRSLPALQVCDNVQGEISGGQCGGSCPYLLADGGVGGRPPPRRALLVVASTSHSQQGQQRRWAT